MIRKPAPWNRQSTAQDYNNLGVLYYTRGDSDQAEQMHRKSLALNRSLGRKEGIAGDYANLGNVYKTRGDLAQAKALWNKSLSLYQEEMCSPCVKQVRQALDKLARQRRASTTR